ncbi:hypothetical protein [Pseudomonas sp.]|uniref:hypothetical protein n=1 Tax=Pseudomonas sp. TaxID=306 RepID=UPI003520E600
MINDDNSQQSGDAILDKLRASGLTIDGDNAYKRDLLDAVVGAMMLGRLNTNPPPADHWAQRFWDIGREYGELPAASPAIVIPMPVMPEQPEDAIDDSWMDGYNAALRMREDCMRAIESAGAALKAQPSVVQWPGTDEIMQMAFEEGQPDDDASGYYFELEEFDLFIQRLMEEVARLNASAAVPDWWPEQWRREGYNGCVKTAVYALRFLRNNRPAEGGEQQYNDMHLMQIAGDLETTMRELLATAPAPAPSTGVYSADPLACPGCVSGCFRCAPDHVEGARKMGSVPRDLLERLEVAARTMSAVLAQEPKLKAVAKRVMALEVARIDAALATLRK